MPEWKPDYTPRQHTPHEVLARGTYDHTGEDPATARLVTLKELVRDQREALPDGVRGIYFMLHDRRVAYVGKSKDIRKRFQSHYSNGRVIWKFAFVNCTEDQETDLENRYIFEYWPALNVRGKPWWHERYLWWEVICPDCSVVFRAPEGWWAPCPHCEDHLVWCGFSPPEKPYGTMRPAEDFQPYMTTTQYRESQRVERVVRRSEKKASMTTKTRRMFGSFELMCLRTYGRLDLARTALRIEDLRPRLFYGEGNERYRAAIPYMQRVLAAHERLALDTNAPLYSVVQDNTWYATLQDAATATGSRVSDITKWCFNGTKNWFFVPYGFNPTPEDPTP